MYRWLTNSPMEYSPILRSWRLAAKMTRMLCSRQELVYSSRRRFTDGGHRPSCPQARQPHCSTTMKYVAIRSLLPQARANNALEPPSPESRENPLESGATTPDSSPAEPYSSPGPPLIHPVEMVDPKLTSDNLTSSENRRTIGKWFRTVMTRGSHNRTPRQTPSEAPPQTGIPLQTRAIPPKEKPSTMAPGKRQKVSVPSCVDTGHGYLTTRLSGRLEGPLSDQRLVHASYLFRTSLLTVFAEEKTAQGHSALRSWFWCGKQRRGKCPLLVLCGWDLR